MLLCRTVALGPGATLARCSSSWTRESCIAALELATRRRRLAPAPANYSAIPPAAPVDLPATIRFNAANLSFPGDSDGAMTCETQRGASASRRAGARHARSGIFGGLRSQVMDRATCVKLSVMLFA
ncbi:hypothetical protein ABIA43_000354 [Bradyrhizobium sp. USDA 328]